MKDVSSKLKLALLMEIVLIIQGCASTPEKGSQEYVREQVYQCRALCANSEVAITKIEGLDCVCNKQQQQPIIFSPIINNNLGGSNSKPQSYYDTAKVNSSSPVKEGEPNLIIKDNAAIINSAEGRTIYSQTK